MLITEGSLIDGKFQIGSTIGHGGMGIVYEAIQLGLDRVVALKLLFNVPEESKDEIVRFEREALILSKLSHINIVQFYAYGTWSGFPYIAMERLAGDSLQKMLAKNAHLSVPKTIEFARQISEGLEHAHAHGIYHRDIKPTNIIITTGPDSRLILKIIDFGLAKLTGSSVQKLTQTNTVLGSVQYMSPEQCTGRSVDHRSDVYSLGCLIYHCLTGDPPYSADNAVAVMFQQVNEPVQNTSGWQRLPNGLQKLVARCMEKEPADRFQSCAELREELIQAAQSDSVVSISSSQNPVAAKADLVNEHFGRKKLPKKSAAISALAITTVVVAAIVYFSAHYVPAKIATSDSTTPLTSPKEIIAALLHRDSRSFSRKAGEIRLNPNEMQQLAQAIEQFRLDPACDTTLLFAAYMKLFSEYEQIGDIERMKTALASAVETGGHATGVDPFGYTAALMKYHELCALSNCELSLVNTVETAMQFFPKMHLTDHHNLTLLLAQDYAKLGRYSEARALLQTVQNAESTAELRKRSTAIKNVLDAKEEAASRIKILSKQLDQEITKKEGTAKTVYKLALSYREIGKDPTDMILQQLARPANPPFEMLLLRFELAKSYLDRGDQRSCERIWSGMVPPLRDMVLQSEQPKVSAVYCEVVLDLARIYLETGRYKECVALTKQWLNDRVRAGPPYLVPAILICGAHGDRHLGAAADAEKLYRQAVSELDSTILIDKRDTQSVNWRNEANCGLACVFISRSKYQDAKVHMDHAINEAEVSDDKARLAICRMVRAACLEKLGKVQAAAADKRLAKREIGHTRPNTVRQISYIYDDVVPLSFLNTK